jgi:hypothetical protein
MRPRIHAATCLKMSEMLPRPPMARAAGSGYMPCRAGCVRHEMPAAEEEIPLGSGAAPGQDPVAIERVRLQTR